MDIFFTDLDNTLIYSHRRQIVSGKILAECINGREQSYMPELLYDYFKKESYYTVVPVTSRSREQFQRVFLLKELNWRCALVCNGGVLIENGIENLGWRSVTMDLSEKQRPEIEKAYQLLCAILPQRAIHYEEPFFLYAVLSSVGETGHNSPADESYEFIQSYLKSFLNDELVNAYLDGRKIYVICKAVDKGIAVRRYKELICHDITIAAGDSTLDAPMFDEVDYGICTDNLKGNCLSKKMLSASRDEFPIVIYKRLLEIQNRGIKIDGR